MQKEKMVMLLTIHVFHLRPIAQHSFLDVTYYTKCEMKFIVSVDFAFDGRNENLEFTRLLLVFAYIDVLYGF